MKKYPSKQSLIFVFLIFLFWIHPVHAKEEKLLQLIQDRYQSIQSFEGKFSQISHLSDQETSSKKATGNVFYKRPGKMRWEYETPEEQLLVTNGKILWLYDPLLENVTIQNIEKLTDGTALAFLLGVGDLRTDFTYRDITKNLIKDSEGLIVELIPKKETANLAFLQIEVNPETYDLQKIALMDRQDNFRIIALESMNYNRVMPDRNFMFEVTPDMEVIQADNS